MNSRNATTLTDTDAVAGKPKPRKVQHRNGSFEVAPPKGWVEMLGVDKQSALMDVKFIKGRRPVLVDEPAIVLRPCSGCETK